ncbi:MAG TPA: protein kinase [Phycisphaerales bacterium]|nr:protein kinase [Phycisphaerales bacterium]HRQ75213.1 protein kinase [Phycisphaerales bacterium]
MPGPIGIPDRIGRYRIRKLIGMGGMGAVYLAEQDSPRKLVAVKILKNTDRLHAAAGAIKRFQDEAQILASLRHPYIIHVYDAGVEMYQGEKFAYFAMEYVPGAMPITDYAAAHGLSVAQRLELMVRVCDAVDQAHRLGIVHRDLKPGNILVDPSGEPKVIDFGIASATMDAHGNIEPHVEDGRVIGTVRYMAPEQIRPVAQMIGPATDVYALGVILYELLCGEMPYNLKQVSLIEAANTICDKPPKRPSETLHRVGGELERMLLGALSKNPRDRPPAAAALGQRMQAYLDRRRPLVELRNAAARFMMRHVVTTALVIVLIASLLTEFVGVPLVYQWTNANNTYLSALASLGTSPPSSDAFRHSRIVRLTDHAASRLSDLADRHGVTGVETDRWTTVRRLHGQLMKQLAKAGVRVVAWDIAFPGETDADEAFLAGVQAIKNAGGDVVITSPDWRVDEHGLALMVNPIFAEHVKWGVASGGAASDVLWELDVVLLRDVLDPIQSFVFATIGAYRNPGWLTDVTFDPPSAMAHIRWYRPDAAGRRTWLPGERLQVRLSGFHTGIDEPQVGISPKDAVGFSLLSIPSDDFLEASSVDYDWVLEASDAEVAARLRGKAVFVGDFRQVAEEERDHPGGRRVHACYAHATLMDEVIAGAVLRYDRIAASRFALIAAAALGVVIGFRLDTRHVPRIVVLAMAAVVIAGFAVFLFAQYRYIINPIVPAIAMVLGGELAAAAWRSRRTSPSI